MASGFHSYASSGNKQEGSGNIQFNGPIAGNLTIPPSDSTIQDQKKKQDECYNALFLTHPEADKGGICSRNGNPVKNTCEWIEEVQEMKVFEQSSSGGSNNFLWIHGGPGKGKTYLSIYLAKRWLSGIDRQQSRPLVLQYYCDSSNPQRNTALCVLRSLLCQLLKAKSNLYDEILGEFDTFCQRNEDLISNHYIEDLWRIFKSMVKNIQQNVFFVLDGLDECDGDSVKFLQAKLEEFYGATGASNDGKMKTILVSRALQNKVQVKLWINLDDLNPEYTEKRTEDLQAFVSDNVDRISSITDDDKKGHLKELLLSRADGTFL